MIQIERETAIKTFADTLCVIFIKNANDYPIKFDDFAKQIIKELEDYQSRCEDLKRGKWSRHPKNAEEKTAPLPTDGIRKSG